MEIHPFLPSATSTDSPVSIRTIEPSDIDPRIPWLTAAPRSTLTTDLDAVSSSKNKTQFIVRGAIYTPRARVSIDPRGNNAQVVLSGGVVAGRLVLTAPAAIGSDKLQIGTGGASGVRRVQIRSEAVERSWCGCAADTDPTGAVRKIVGYATLAVTGTGLTIESWRIGS